jgi:putative ABC transport system ATP-binding protein
VSSLTEKAQLTDGASGAADLPAALQVSSLLKSYGLVEVLHGVDLEVAAGERVALMGRSGSGKSTLLNCICGIEPFDGGAIRVAGRSLGEMAAPKLEQMRRAQIGYVFQTFHLLPTLTALENIEFPGQLVGLPSAKRLERARALLDRVGLADRANHRPDALSGGERQRVALARAVMNEPPLILADEPTGSLDLKSGDQVLDLIDEVSRDEGIAVLLVTHDANTARICQRIVHMADGRIADRAS